MTADNRTNKRVTGDKGEDIACEFLVKRGFSIVERNYLRKWGELDVIAEKKGVMRFVEVKTIKTSLPGNNVSHGTLLANRVGVTHATSSYRPEENMHPAKIKRLLRTIQTYLLDKNIEKEWQLDLVTVQIDTETRKARVELIENVNI